MISHWTIYARSNRSLTWLPFHAFQKIPSCHQAHGQCSTDWQTSSKLSQSLFLERCLCMSFWCKLSPDLTKMKRDPFVKISIMSLWMTISTPRLYTPVVSMKCCQNVFRLIRATKLTHMTKFRCALGRMTVSERSIAHHALLSCTFRNIRGCMVFPSSHVSTWGGDTVRVHYEGYVTVAGKGERKFDSSRERDRPLDFVLGKKKVIKCWERDIPEVFLDSRVIISCPPNEAYGRKGYKGLIPPDATLRFDVKLLAINPSPMKDEVPKLKPSELEFAARYLHK